MLRRAWKPLAAVAAVGGPTYWWYTRTPSPETFDVAVREMGPDGKPHKVVRALPLLPRDAVDARIREHATLDVRALADGRTWNISTAYVASNDPIEDRHAHAVVRKSTLLPDERLFVAVMDGHAGFHTSQFLSLALIPTVAAELDEAARPAKTAPSITQRVSSLLGSRSAADEAVARQLSPAETSRAIQNAFTKLDYEIITAPLKVFAAALDKSGLQKDTIPDLSENKLAVAAMQPALSGSCAIMAVLDPTAQDMHVACTGDARAVAGYWEESADGKGRWRVEVLSEDQTGRNPNELKRIRSEHPPEEADQVVMRGRILGGLEPSRAFGDARYKWPAPLQDALSKAFKGIGFRPPPSLLRTPPYVTATPVVTHRMLGLHPSSAPLTSGSVPSMRFVVLATDGLWDQLSSKDAVALVGSFLQGVKGTTVPKTALPAVVEGDMGVDGKEKQEKEKEGSWAFVDDNVSAHLIRNAFGGGDELMLRKLLSIPAPHSRRYRDDVTVTVVWWDEGTGAEQVVKAKL